MERGAAGAGVKMKTVVRVIDSISDTIGRYITSWLLVGLVSVICVKVFARYLLREPTIWSYETATMLGLTIALLAYSYTLRHRGHVRVDVFYSRLSRRKQALLDLISHVLLFFPFLSAVIYTSFNKLLFSISMNEILDETNWYPPAWPIRLIFFAGLSLLVMQGVAEFIRDFYLVVRNQKL